jgi:hypothetical protein
MKIQNIFEQIREEDLVNEDCQAEKDGHINKIVQY